MRSLCGQSHRRAQQPHRSNAKCGQYLSLCSSARRPPSRPPPPQRRRTPQRPHRTRVPSLRSLTSASSRAAWTALLTVSRVSLRDCVDFGSDTHTYIYAHTRTHTYTSENLYPAHCFEKEHFIDMIVSYKKTGFKGFLYAGRTCGCPNVRGSSGRLQRAHGLTSTAGLRSRYPRRRRRVQEWRMCLCTLRMPVSLSLSLIHTYSYTLTQIAAAGVEWAGLPHANEQLVVGHAAAERLPIHSTESRPIDTVRQRHIWRKPVACQAFCAVSGS